MSIYSLILGIGATLALLRVLRWSPAAERIGWILAGLTALIGSLIGARIGFIIAYFGYFKTMYQEIFQFWLGGLSWSGAFAGAILFIWIAAGLIRKPFKVMADKLSVMLLPIAAAVWLGCWRVGVAYGQTLQTGTWWGIQTRDESGLEILRVPVQPVAILSLMLFLILAEWFFGRSQKPGVKAIIVGLVFSLHTLLFSFMRADPVQRFFEVRLDTWLAFLFVIGFAILLFIIIYKKPKQSSLDKNLLDGVVQ